MELLKKIFRDSSEIDFKKVWEEGIFVFDTNVLLDLYRLPASAKDDLISTLEHKTINSRIWITSQVIIEFLNNRISVIASQKNMFSTVIKEINDAVAKHDEITNSLKDNLEKLKLTQKHSLIDPTKFLNEENIDSSKKYLTDFALHLKSLEEQHIDVNSKDVIKAKIFSLFNTKIGDSLSKNELEEIYKKGENRYKDKIPPGFKDDEKIGSYYYGDNTYQRKFGDLILWNEIIRKCKQEKIKY